MALNEETQNNLGLQFIHAEVATMFFVKLYIHEAIWRG